MRSPNRSVNANNNANNNASNNANNNAISSSNVQKSVSSTISRFACRILADREEPNKAYVFAAGFDNSKNIFLGVCPGSFYTTNYDMVSGEGH